MIISDISNKEYPSLEENFQTILDSLTKEKAAVEKLIRLEGEKMKGFAGDELDLPFIQVPNDILRFVQSTKRICDLITLKGLFLNQKLQNVLLLEKKMINDNSKRNGFDFQTSIDIYISSLEKLIDAVNEGQEISSDSSLPISLQILDQMRRQMMLLAGKNIPSGYDDQTNNVWVPLKKVSEKKKYKKVVKNKRNSLSSPPLPPPWRPKK